MCAHAFWFRNNRPTESNAAGAGAGADAVRAVTAAAGTDS